jgi:hypothetical protein
MRRTAHLSPRAIVLPVALIVVFSLAACARPAASPSPSGGAGGTGGIQHPAGNELVFRIEYTGGFVPPEVNLSSLPFFSLTGDGRVIMLGAQIDIFPGPLMPAVQVRRLTEGGVQSVLEAIAASRQFGGNVEWRGAQNFVADASDTVFTLHAEGREVTVQVYGLGTVAFPGQEPPPNFPAAELAAHTALQTLVDRLTTIDQWLPASSWADAAWHAYEPTALRLLVRNADADPPDDTGIGNTEIEWPVAGDPATFGDELNLEGFRCGVVTGEDAAAWLAVLSTANQLTRFTADGHKYAITVRPVLPDEPEACPAL